MLIMMIFMIVGAIDRIRGNKLGYGEKFEDGFNAIGGLPSPWPAFMRRPRAVHGAGPHHLPIYTAIGADASNVLHSAATRAATLCSGLAGLHR